MLLFFFFLAGHNADDVAETVIMNGRFLGFLGNHTKFTSVFGALFEVDSH